MLERFFLSCLPYIHFKTKSDMFLTLIPSCTFVILHTTQISSVFLIFKKSTSAFLYPSADSRCILYIQKKQNYFFKSLNWHYLISCFQFFLLISHLHFLNFLYLLILIFLLQNRNKIFKTYFHVIQCLFSLHLTIIRILSCFFLLFLVILSNFLIIPVVKEKIKVKLVPAIPTGAPTHLRRHNANSSACCRKKN